MPSFEFLTKYLILVTRRRTLESSHLDSSDDDCFVKPAANVRAQKFSKISNKKKTGI